MKRQQQYNIVFVFFVIATILIAGIPFLLSFHRLRNNNNNNKTTTTAVDDDDAHSQLLVRRFFEKNPLFFWKQNYHPLMNHFGTLDFRGFETNGSGGVLNCSSASKVVDNKQLRVVTVNELPNESDVILRRIPELEAPRIPFEDGNPIQLLSRGQQQSTAVDNFVFFGFSQVQGATPNPPVNSSYVAILRNTFIGQSGKIYSCSKQINARGCMSYLELELPTHNPARVVVTSHKKLAPLIQYWSYGYYHFLTESLSRLGMLHALLQQDPEIQILVDQSGFAMQYLELLNISNSRVVWYNSKAVRFAEQLIYVPESTCDYPNILPLLRVRELLLSSVRANETALQPPESIWSRLSRVLFGTGRSKSEMHPSRNYCLESGALLCEKPGDYILVVNRKPENWRKKLNPDFTGNRHILNLEQLQIRLQEEYPRERFVFAYMEDLGSVSAQISLFRNAKMLIAPHGANNANMLFMPLHPSSTIIEIIPERYYQFGSYYKLARQMRFQYYYWRVPHGSKWGNFDVDVDLIVETVGKALFKQLSTFASELRLKIALEPT